MGVYHNFVYGTIYIITKYMGVSLYGMSIDIWDYLCYNGYCQKGKAHEQGRGVRNGKPKQEKAPQAETYGAAHENPEHRRYGDRGLDYRLDSDVGEDAD